ncbi:MAG: hypothetical protein EOM34_03135 [Clostridia bacterium]|nr:hypothetical protein [Lachnospiraceae bacterium]NCB99657.1 hypothetical protein [Clostridia bacterium]NCD04059.1 hypothetical protein [Clostridia bacterium]
MFRMWMKIFKENRLLKDTVICVDNLDMNRTAKVFHAVSEGCLAFDLPQPIWLDANIREFQRHNKTRFTQDNFVEEIPFDFWEIHIIEED